MNTNTLFFSHNCETCKKLIMLLRNENLLSFFKMICVDDKLGKLPKDIVRVPTMIIVGINKPLTAHETFQWVEQMKFIRQQQVMDINKKIIQQYNTSNQQKGPLGYSEEIMSGYSDNFAFTKSDNSLPHSYVNINDEDKNAIFTAPQEKHRVSKLEQQKITKEIEERRNMQDTEYQTLMKQKQLEFVMQAEHEKLLQQQNKNTF